MQDFLRKGFHVILGMLKIKNYTMVKNTIIISGYLVGS